MQHEAPTHPAPPVPPAARRCPEGGAWPADHTAKVKRWYINIKNMMRDEVVRADPPVRRGPKLDEVWAAAESQYNDFKEELKVRAWQSPNLGKS